VIVSKGRKFKTGYSISFFITIIVSEIFPATRRRYPFDEEQVKKELIRRTLGVLNDNE